MFLSVLGERLPDDTGRPSVVCNVRGVRPAQMVELFGNIFTPSNSSGT